MTTCIRDLLENDIIEKAKADSVKELALSHLEKRIMIFGEIHLYMGPMFSGKTTELQRLVGRYKKAKRNTILFKHETDDLRNGLQHQSVTHDGILMPAYSVKGLNSLIEYMGVYDVIGIDEGQFFGDLVDFCRVMVNRGKIVIVASLDGTYERKPFPITMELIPYCKKVIKLNSVCRLCGEDAAFSRRLSLEKKTELVGGDDMYHANCEFCFNMTFDTYISAFKGTL